MAKPFALQELEARVRALTRRGLGTAATVIKHGPLAFDATGRVAYLNDQMVELSARELSLPKVLLQRAGRLVSKEQPSSACANGATRSATTRSRSTSTACARRSSKGRCASRPCAAWAIASRRSPARWHRARPCPTASPTAAPATFPVIAAPRSDALRGQRSLFGEILDWMLAPLLLLWPMSVALTWLVAQNIANHPYDRALGETARLLSRQVVVDQGQVTLALPAGIDPALRTDETDELFFQVLGARGEIVAGDATLPVPPSEEAVTLGELRFRDETVRDQAVRVAYLWLPSPRDSGARGGLAGDAPSAGSPALVQVAETLAKRSQLATEIIKGVILPQFVILPLAVLLVWLALVRGIAPLGELQQRIRLRAADDLSPIDEREAPEEVSPLVRAINELLGRLDRSFSTQRRFLANAAHQLKTPLAGLRTQAELAQREIDRGERDPEALKRALQQIARSSQRAAHTVNQLLSMARAEDRGDALSAEAVDLAALAMETVQDFVPRALERRIDLGYEGPPPPDERASAADASRVPAQVAGHPVLLGELIRNLVDNALHYTPSGGTITVRVVEDADDKAVVLQVEDSGPGIPATERELVFQPFYRALGTGVDGSGLGLTIVAEIARRHGASLNLDDAHAALAPQAAAPEGQGPGARFTLRFPALPDRSDETDTAR